ncbi:MAG TPA: GNAT family N-acetyltransferase [Acidimicrobiales bacterium]|nr:GNAT family N-acetyltransferase [Acidimicrobiales bacterium]
MPAAPSPPQVRQATLSDVPALSAALARAFAEDPVISWIFPTDDIERRLTAYFAMYLRRISLRHGVTYTTDGVQGGAIWLPPGKWELTPFDIVRTLPTTARTLGPRLISALRTLLQIERHHPRDAHYYLATLGTDPPQQGKGVGSALLVPVLTRCDAEGIPAFLESSKERNVPFYARYGFEVTEELDLRNGGPRLWLMRREPRAPEA